MARTLEHRLLERRIVLVNGVLDEATAGELAARLMFLDGTGDDAIELRYSCRDGELGAAIALADTVELLAVELRATAAGAIGGPAILPFAVATRRIAHPYATFQLRGPEREMRGRVTDLLAEATRQARLVDDMYRRLAEATGRSNESIGADFAARRLLTAHDAMTTDSSTRSLPADARARSEPRPPACPGRSSSCRRQCPDSGRSRTNDTVTRSRRHARGDHRPWPARGSGSTMAKERLRVRRREEGVMGEPRRLDVQDALWLEMDRPTNLMVVDSLVWTATPIDWERLRAVVRERLWDRYVVFRSIAARGDDGAWYWTERHDDDFDAHLEHVVLSGAGDEAALQELIGSQRVVALDRDRPLWRMFLVDGYRGGSAIVTRTHHAIADGIRMVQLAMSLFDASPDGGAIMAPPVHQRAATSAATRRSAGAALVTGATAVAYDLYERAGSVAGRVGDVATDPLGATSEQLGELGHLLAHGAASAVGTSGELARTAITNPVGAAHSAATMAGAAVEVASSWLRSSMPPWPSGRGPLVDLFSAAPGDIDFARKLLLGTRNDTTCWTGPVGTRKAVAWSAPLPLDDVKAVARAHDATVNDVLVTCVAGTLHSYLRAHEAVCASVNWMIPVNLKALDTTLPEDLGNSFAIVQLELPTNVADPLVVLDVVRQRMGRIKSGHEAAVAFRIQEVISGMSKSVYRVSVDLLANRAIGVLTNVPGPPIPVYLAGQRVEGMVGWAPLSGNQPMCFTIYSYDGKVFVGIACDVGLVPDHQQIVDGFADAFHRLAVASR